MSDSESPMRGSQVRILAGLAVVFVCGLLVGSVAATAYHDYQGGKKWERGLAGMKPRLMKHLTSELRLSSEQERQIEPIVTQAEGELLRLRIAQQPRVEEIVDRTIETLKPTLTAEQQSKLDELYRGLQRRWESDSAYVRRLPQ
jgi:Spy/CpxP family protein refolding chaperone